ncbi:MAG: bifunctional metallophosphatase/5'-nucleotidase [Clostridiaceae bacterium]|nr:bifunctional metallophosphatase/5'-nucleotidase [Clostridiaceae bacterium]
MKYKIVKPLFVLSIILVLAMTFQVLCPCLLPGTAEVFAAQVAQAAQEVQPGSKITILFTHDKHDHFLPFKTLQEGKVVQLGGYARLQSTINEERQENPDLLLLDAGDFSMGTLFQTMFASDGIGLRIMGKMGYDVVTLGNHEFDFRADGLAASLDAARKSGDKLPLMVVSNGSFPVDKDRKMDESLAKLKKAMDDYGVREYVIIERSGVKIGIFGLMGKESASQAPMSGMVFTDPVEKAKEIVKKLKEDEKVELIICLSHSGTEEKKTDSEDEILAKKVPGIDVIISGHSHRILEEPIIAGNTIIGSCGENGANLGILSISRDPGTTGTGGTGSGAWKLVEYKLKPIDSSLPENPGISQTIDQYKEMVQENYLDKLGMKFDDVLARTDFSFNSLPDMREEHREEPLGNLIGDAYIYAVKRTEGANYEPVTAAVVPAGTIRGSFVKGDITVYDAFNASSLGIGKDKMSGYPLISVYLTGKELKTVCEVDASIAPIMQAAQLHISGLKYSFNPRRLIFNRVTRVQIQKPDGTLEEIDDNRLYRVIAGLYTAQMLSVVGEKSFGLLSIVPKTRDGSPITDFEEHIITDASGGRNNEVKEWLAIAMYLQSFDKMGGIPRVPEYYSQPRGRKIVETSSDIISLLSNPNGITLGVYAIIIVIASVVILAIVMIIRRKRRRRRAYNVKLVKM